MSTKTGLDVTIAGDCFPEVLEALRNPENSELDPYALLRLLGIGITDEDAMKFARRFRLKPMDGEWKSMDESMLIMAIRFRKLTVDELIEFDDDYLMKRDFTEPENVGLRNDYLEARVRGVSHQQAKVGNFDVG